MDALTVEPQGFTKDELEKLVKDIDKLTTEMDQIGVSIVEKEKDAGADVGSSGDCKKTDVCQEEEKETKETRNLPRDPEVAERIKALEEKYTKSDCNKLFMNKVAKKTNMYKPTEQPLNNPWTFWVDRSRRGAGVEEFESNLIKIRTVYTVHLFWTVFYNIPLPSTLGVRSSLHLSRDERKPIWEAPYNCKGGTFRLRLKKKDTDRVWRELLMAAAGETLVDYVSEKDEICGVSVSIRETEDVVLIWNANAEEADKARVFDCARALVPDAEFFAFYKAHQTHQAFNKHTTDHTGRMKRST